MTEEYYEQYHQKGGTYALPAEIFNELFEKLSEKTKILEELKKWLESNYCESQDIWYIKIFNKIEELEGDKND